MSHCSISAILESGIAKHHTTRTHDVESSFFFFHARNRNSYRKVCCYPKSFDSNYTHHLLPLQPSHFFSLFSNTHSFMLWPKQPLKNFYFRSRRNFMYDCHGGKIKFAERYRYMLGVVCGEEARSQGAAPSLQLSLQRQACPEVRDAKNCACMCTATR